MENIKKNPEKNKNIQDTYTYIYNVKENKLVLQNCIMVELQQTTNIIENTYTEKFGNTM